MVLARKSFKGSVTYGSKTASLDADKKALGVGGIFGIHVRPLKYLDIGVRYETETPLEFETSSTVVNISTDKGRALESFADGAKEKRNLPATLGAGVALHVPGLTALTISANLTYYFIQQADSSEDGNRGNPLTEYVISYDDDYKNGIELGVNVEYAFTKNLVASVGYNRNWTGANAKTLSDFEYILSSNTVGGGARYTFFDRLKITAAMGVAIYDSAENESLQSFLKLPAERFSKLNVLVALGAEYRLF